MSDDALQIAEKRREAKGKGEKERYTHWMQSLKEKQGEIRKPSSVTELNWTLQGCNGPLQGLLHYIIFSQVVIIECLFTLYML